jgi:2-amino-4-hydroxy-6-hydroxymethyldihydropteridine diphosphokinase
VAKKNHTIYLALGSNLGDRATNLKLARTALLPKVSIEACSPIYETPPWGYSNQPAFLNQVVKASTCLDPLKLLDFIKDSERKLGRQVSFRNGPRLIDIDILFYDNLILKTPHLSIPHPRMQDRAFVWLPLATLAPELRHPILNKTAREVLAELDTTGIHLYSQDCLETLPSDLS